jgi:hypothetical protein
MSNTSKKPIIVKKLKKADGTIAYVKDGKLHNWDGPALIPEGDMKKAEYYINGIQYTKDEFEQVLRDQEGLPWYKNQSMKSKLEEGYRN